MSWVPKLDRSAPTPIYRQLADAMADDIRKGRLEAGTKLPPHRQLAHALGISVGAVTRGYDEAAVRGLVAGHIGRGTYVVDQSPSPSHSEVDLSRTVVPVDASGAVADAVISLRRRPLLIERLSCELTSGFDRDRQAAAAWLMRTANFERLAWDTLICCLGAQNALAIALAALGRTDEPLMCESSTFSGVKALAALMGRPLHGIEMDSEGATPDGLAKAAAETGARLFYTIPTLQNPTGRVMGMHRREEIVRVARRHDLWLIEDDIYAAYARGAGLPPLAVLAPERTVYISSLSKIIAPGLRTGFLAAPAGDAFERCQRAAKALMHSPPGLTGAVATHLIEGGGADSIADIAIVETRRRMGLARAILGDLAPPTFADAGLHIWVPMREIDAERAVSQGMRSGIRLASPTSFGVAGGRFESGLRLCLGGAGSYEILERALLKVRDIARGDGVHLDQDLF